MKAMIEQGGTAERQADARARREVLAALARETGGAESTTRRPEMTAALVAVLAEHGLRRVPEQDGLRRALHRARSRQSRAASGGALTRGWLRASDNAFARQAGLANIVPVTRAVGATCHDGAETRFVGLLAAVMASYYRSEDIGAFLATHDDVTEKATRRDAAPRVPEPRYRTRFAHRVAPARRPVQAVAHRRPAGRHEEAAERVLR